MFQKWDEDDGKMMQKSRASSVGWGWIDDDEK